MPVIKPRTRGKDFVRLITLLEQENYQTVHAYAHFIGESADYVLNQLVEAVLAKDDDYLAWRTTHPQSYATKSTSTKGSKPGNALRPVAAHG